MNNDKKTIERRSEFEPTGGESAADIAWQMFKKSGNINYYRLYSDLKKKDN